MNKIKVLDSILANKIAAGEVIEKVSSVVKELIENSIDAKSENIVINLIDGGLKSIEVIDDGTGMSKEDALLSFSRHATSKINKTDDLFFISSLGFRGEALPSIASVSKVELITNNTKTTVKIIVDNGEIKSVEEVASKKGTKIIVSELFYNTPARLKFLKNEVSELNSVVFLIEKTALANPNISFTLTNNEKLILKTTKSDNLLQTIHEIYGLSISQNMLKLSYESDDFILKGYISKPSVTRTNRNHFHTFINDRVIKNYEINKAINDAYYTYKPTDRFPIIVLNIYIDPTLVDVNIHPAKQDVKLSKIEDLKKFIYESIKDVLYSNLLIPQVDLIEKEPETVEKNYEEISLDFGLEPDFVEKEDIKGVKLYPVGLLHGTYIAAENEEGVYLIDQHAAAERINYELYQKMLAEEKINKKTMLFPITIELLKSEYDKFKEKEKEFKKLGFDYEDFGINTILVKAHPDYLKEGFEEEQVKKIIDLVLNLEENFKKEKFLENVAITLACKMSVKGNTKISHLEQEYLLDELLKTDNPYTCPHGRPTMIKFTIYELEKLFKRAK